MARVKRGKTANKKRKKILGYTKGFRWGRRTKERAAKEALLHAWTHSFRGRKEKKRDYRALWQTQINAGARMNGLTYGKLISGLKKNKIIIDRKILADLVKNEPEVFKKLVEKAK